MGPAVADARTAAMLAEAVLAAARRALDDPSSEQAIRVVRDLLRLRRPLGIGVDLDRPQELVVDAIAANGGPSDGLRALAALVGVATPG